VVQVRKKNVAQSIVDSAYDLFSDRGYHATTLQDIAQYAGVGVSSLYSYFPSKFHLLYAVVEPWYKEAFARLEKRVQKQKTRRDKLRVILLGIWRDMPMENVGLSNSLMEALSSSDQQQKKTTPLLPWVEQKLKTLLDQALPTDTGIDYDVLPNLFMMAYDGFVINRRLNELRDIERLADALCDILLKEKARA
jgi:AcrR family transcriptional regulator